MCGIVGIYLKNKALSAELGSLFKPMLIGMSQRGPDSSGFAIYRDPVPAGSLKLVLQHRDLSYDWHNLANRLATEFNTEVNCKPIHTHCLFVLQASEAELRKYLNEQMEAFSIVSIGQHIEIYKEVGMPEQVAEVFGLADMHGSHIIGHTRMATESAVTTAGSHPFSTGNDLCLVHNGSLSNHNRLRKMLVRAGAVFQTENDSEVAAKYFDVRMQQGHSLEQTLEMALSDLDGFYTFAIGTSNGFAVLRDPVACKPAVMAETDDWVAIASEYRSLSGLPGIEQASVWEPEPARAYVWEGPVIQTAAAASENNQAIEQGVQ